MDDEKMGNEYMVRSEFNLRSMYGKKMLVFVSLFFMVVLVSSFFVALNSGGGGSFFVSGVEVSDVVVGSEVELLDAIGAAPDKTFYAIGLSGDIVLASSLEIPVGKDIVLVGVGGVWRLVGVHNQSTITVVGSLTIDSICVTHVAGETGRGVYVERGGVFTMLGGMISGNIVGDSGGGVYIKEGTFVMLGGEITDNTATDGGGVYSDNGILDKRDGAIEGNTATRASSSYNDVSQTISCPRPSEDYYVSQTEFSSRSTDVGEPFYLLIVGVTVVAVIMVGLFFYRSKKQNQPTTKNLIDTAVI
jgi:hypothetical protein